MYEDQPTLCNYRAFIKVSQLCKAAPHVEMYLRFTECDVDPSNVTSVSHDAGLDGGLDGTLGAEKGGRRLKLPPEAFIAA